MDRRKVWLTYDFNLQPNDKLEMEKLTTVYTSRDKEFDKAGIQLQQLREHSLQDLQNSAKKDMIHYFSHIKRHGRIRFGMPIILRLRAIMPLINLHCDSRFII